MRRFSVALAILEAAMLASAFPACPAAGQPPAAPSSPPSAADLQNPLQTQIQAQIQAQIQTLISTPAASRAHWGIAVTALDGTPIASYNEGQLFQPASNTKLYTTAAALALLGPEQRFTTRVEYGSAGQSGPTVRGDLVLIGSGDGTFADPDAPYREPSSTAPASTSSPPAPLTFPELAGFADQVARSGVKRITGDIIGDDTVFPWQPYPEDWAVDDLPWGYGAPVSGLTLADNQVRIVVRPGKRADDKPAIDVPQWLRSFYTLDAEGLVTGPARSGSHVQMDRAPGSRKLRVFGSIAVDAPPDAEEIAIADPAEFAAAVLKQMLEQRGVQADGTARAKHRLVSDGMGFREESHKPLPNLPKSPIQPGLSKLLTGAVSCSDACPVILQHTSLTVAEDVLLTNKSSQNLHAELLLRHLGKMYGQPAMGGDSGIDGSNAEGVRVVRQFLINAGIDPKDFVFYDGSGLSGHDLTTPRATAKLLSYAAHDPTTGQPQPWFAQWRASLPVAGVDGTLAGRFKDPPFQQLKGHVFAKTGTLGEARALSGYLECASGRTVIFSIMVNAFVPGTPEIRDTVDRIVASIAAAL